jgi:hypothetical protein
VLFFLHRDITLEIFNGHAHGINLLGEVCLVVRLNGRKDIFKWELNKKGFTLSSMYRDLVKTKESRPNVYIGS